MRILVNISNLKIGGALQVAYSFMSEIINLTTNHKFYVVLSDEIDKELNFKLKNPKKNIKIFKLNSFPGPLFKGIKARKELYAIESLVKPDVVFSIFGPTYWKPKTIHVSGFAAGWTINPDSIAFQVLSVMDRVKKKFQNWIKLKSSIRESSFFIVETLTVKNRLNKYAKVPLENIFVVGNTYGNHFNIDISEKKFILPIKKDEHEFRFVTITANYPHKNLSIINSIIPLLIKKKLNVKFYLTIPQDEFKENFDNFKNHLINLGPIKVEDCPVVYRDSDALFLPTLLESFTASYPEAMISRKPILTSDLDFSHDICGDAACYFNPLDPVDIVDKIEQIVLDKSFYDNLVSLGTSRVSTFSSAKVRIEQYISICEKIDKINK